MKRRGPSNVVALPAWMQRFQVKEPEHYVTADHIQVCLALSIRLHDSPEMLRDTILKFVHRVPVKQRKMIQRMADSPDVMAVSIDFINIVSRKLGDFTEFRRYEPEPSEQSSGEPDCNGPQGHESSSDSGVLESPPDQAGT